MIPAGRSIPLGSRAGAAPGGAAGGPAVAGRRARSTCCGCGSPRAGAASTARRRRPAAATARRRHCRPGVPRSRPRAGSTRRRGNRVVPADTFDERDGFGSGTTLPRRRRRHLRRRDHRRARRRRHGPAGPGQRHRRPAALRARPATVPLAGRRDQRPRARPGPGRRADRASSASSGSRTCSSGSPRPCWLMDVDFWRQRWRREPDRQPSRRPTAIPGDGVPAARARAMGGRDRAARPRHRHRGAVGRSSRTRCRQRARERHRDLSDLSQLDRLRAGAPGPAARSWSGRRSRAPTRDTDGSSMQMPPFMRNSNAGPLSPRALAVRPADGAGRTPSPPPASRRRWPRATRPRSVGAAAERRRQVLAVLDAGGPG